MHPRPQPITSHQLVALFAQVRSLSQGLMRSRDTATSYASLRGLLLSITSPTGLRAQPKHSLNLLTQLDVMPSSAGRPQLGHSVGGSAPRTWRSRCPEITRRRARTAGSSSSRSSPPRQRTRPTPEGLRFLSDRLGDRLQAGLLLHTGPLTARLSERIWATPVSARWGGTAPADMPVPVSDAESGQSLASP